jgi:hypothetical protein
MIGSEFRNLYVTNHSIISFFESLNDHPIQTNNEVSYLLNHHKSLSNPSQPSIEICELKLSFSNSVEIETIGTKTTHIFLVFPTKDVVINMPKRSQANLSEVLTNHVNSVHKHSR